jgi:hypothetical protein
MFHEYFLCFSPLKGEGGGEGGAAMWLPLLGGTPAYQMRVV